MKCEQMEIYLTGYLDGELTQQQAQRVEQHLEECSDCRRLLERLRTVGETTRQLEVETPDQREWEMIENYIFTRITRRLGWLILIVWSLATVAYASYQYAIKPDEPLLEKVLVFGLFSGLALLFFSVLSERLRESRTDRYRGVRK